MQKTTGSATGKYITIFNIIWYKLFDIFLKEKNSKKPIASIVSNNIISFNELIFFRNIILKNTTGNVAMI